MGNPSAYAWNLITQEVPGPLSVYPSIPSLTHHQFTNLASIHSSIHPLISTLTHQSTHPFICHLPTHPTCLPHAHPFTGLSVHTKPQHASTVLVVVDTCFHSTIRFYVLFGCPTIPLSLKLYEQILYLFTNLTSKPNIRACFPSLFVGEILQRQRWDVFQLVLTSLL